MLPKFLSTLDEGKYPEGGVYAIVRITALPVPNSKYDGIADSELGSVWNHSYAGTSDPMIGYMRDLDESTRKYLSTICVPTITMFSESDAEKKAKAIENKKELWRKATIMPEQIEGRIKAVPRPDPQLTPHGNFHWAR